MVSRLKKETYLEEKEKTRERKNGRGAYVTWHFSVPKHYKLHNKLREFEN